MGGKFVYCVGANAQMLRIRILVQTNLRGFLVSISSQDRHHVDRRAIPDDAAT